LVPTVASDAVTCDLSIVLVEEPLPQDDSDYRLFLPLWRLGLVPRLGEIRGSNRLFAFG
jgi:hypothetical protein